MINSTPHEASIVIGASSEIARSCVSQLLSRDIVITVSRTELNLNTKHFYSDYTEESIRRCVDEISLYLSDNRIKLKNILIFNGALNHSKGSPEKSISELSPQAFEESIKVNSLIPIIWLKNLMPMIVKAEQPKILVSSARVGSISDNNKGGWYSYRASKAALNMMLKTFTLECFRRNKSASVLAYHPGTVDTAMTKPFQKYVKHAIHTPSQAAEYLLINLNNITPSAECYYLDWKGDKIEW